MSDYYRCSLTIDIEELIAMTNIQPTKYTIIAHYKSGRTEEISGDLNKSGVLPATARKKLDA